MYHPRAERTRPPTRVASAIGRMTAVGGVLNGYLPPLMSALSF